MPSAERWRCVYAGAPDTISKAGVSQPSWYSFDKRVWQKGEHEIELTNRTAIEKVRAPGKIAIYQVVLRRGSEVLRTVRGHDWQALVRQAKAAV